jgi:hypothetical protein
LDLSNLNCKALENEIEGKQQKIERPLMYMDWQNFNIVKMAILPKENYIFNQSPSKSQCHSSEIQWEGGRNDPNIVRTYE